MDAPFICPGCGRSFSHGGMGIYCSPGCRDAHRASTALLDRMNDERRAEDDRKEAARAARRRRVAGGLVSMLLALVVSFAHALWLGLKIIWAVFFYPLRAVYRRHFARTKQPAGGAPMKAAEYALLGSGYLLLAFVAVAIVMIAVIGVQVGLHRQAVQKELAAYSSLWDEGKRAEAVEQYKGLIENDLASMPKSDRTTVVSRVVEFEAERGDTDSAKKYIELAQKQGIPLSLTGQQAKEVLAEVEREQKQAAERANRDRQERLAAIERERQEKANQVKGENEKAKERVDGPVQGKKEPGEPKQEEKRVKLAAFKAIVEKLDKFPDVLAPAAEKMQYADELRKLFNTYEAIPFDPKANRDEAKQIVQLFETKVSGRYSGREYNLIEGSVRVLIRRLME